MKHYLGFIFLILLTSCATNNIKTIEGKWQQDFLDYKSKVVEVPLSKSNAIMDVSKIKSKLTIEFDFQDGYEKDVTDSIVFNFPQLKFRKINLDKTSNYYDLNYDTTCDCLLGEMKSYSGNVLNIKLNRVSSVQ
ncbi:hypothetical protein OBJ96_12515 [Empedobacter falsenii]|uniref:Lipoprotein n=1 Tax=Empedobacter stercoris TaxID=1628248 RepID=A0ABX1WL60_9FLAO|nr:MULTISPECIES: hypothetical protein [Empedobacter]MCA4775930.1 hypothetical protein [Empedobacter stercoris]MCA4810025.1 hypothetical protein [Empedobacter stercoris]MDM1523150.1 hypothetical protein [Empedobacter sp. 225-1]MDM1543122.1 hypothetical protein [Empedobacter sp. 189-2]NOJ75409.1 hypothetical protein [Empedobacter stercoris]